MKRLLIAGVIALMFGSAGAQTDNAMPRPESLADPIVALLPAEDQSVTITCDVGRDGRVKKVISNSATTMLKPLYEQAARTWRFSPAVRQGQPVESRVSVVFRYQVKKFAPSTMEPVR